MPPGHRLLLTALLTLMTFAATSTSLAMPSAGMVENHDRWLVLDFDGTCTNFDTTPLLPKLAALLAGDTATMRDERLAKFNALEQEYFEMYQTAKDHIFNDGDGGEGDTLGLDDALDALDQVSTDVTRKVSESRCLAGLGPPHPSQIAELMDRHPEEIGQLASLRSGCVSALANAHRKGWKLGVLSINWCPPLIEAALLLPVQRHLQSVPGVAAGEPNGVSSFFAGRVLPQAEIWSNAIDSDGVVTLHVPGASAKKARIAALRSRAKSRSSLVVYIGDSSTDLSGLLEADVGVMIGDSKTTSAIAKRWGVRLAPLFERRHRHNGPGSLDEDTVWMAQSWEEIESLLRSL